MSTAENLNKNNFTMRAFASCLVSRSLKLLRTKILDNSTLFDIGTGDGSTTIYSFIGNSGIKFSKIIGSDINPEFVQFANRKFGDAVTTFEVYDAAGEIPETIKSSGPFDVVSSFHCLHWMKFEDIKKSILNIKTLLKPNGYFYFFFPLNLSPSKMKEKLLQRFPPGTFDLTAVFQFYKTVMKDQNFPDELREFLKTEGFELELFEVPALQLAYDLEEIREIFKSIMPFFKDMKENEMEQLLNTLVEIYDASSEELTGEPRNIKLNFIHCLGKLTNK